MYSLALKDLPGEIWKDIEEFKGIYQISNKGRVKSLDRVITRVVHRSSRTRHIPEKILQTPNGAIRLSMGIRGVGKSINVDILVAKAFIKDYIRGKTRIMHINGDRTDNRVENLIISTRTDVFYNSVRLGKTMGCPLKKVKCIETGQIFNSINEACRWLGYKSNYCLSRYLRDGKRIIKNKYVCKRKRVSEAKKYYYGYTIKGYHFEYAD